jgi:hypothetical protein
MTERTRGTRWCPSSNCLEIHDAGGLDRQASPPGDGPGATGEARRPDADGMAAGCHPHGHWTNYQPRPPAVHLRLCTENTRIDHHITSLPPRTRQATVGHRRSRQPQGDRRGPRPHHYAHTRPATIEHGQTGRTRRSARQAQRIGEAITSTDPTTAGEAVGRGSRRAPASPGRLRS